MACRVDSDVPDALVGDCNRLRQVAVNLVSKAIKFSESLPILQDTPERKLAREALRRAHDEFGHLHPVHGHTPVRRPLGDDVPLWLTGQWLGRRAWPLHSMARQTVTRRTEPPQT